MGQVERRAHRLLELAAVRLEQRSAAVREEVLVLGIHDHGDAPLLRERHRPLDHRRRERALVVVLDEHGIGVGHGRVDLPEQLVLGAGGDRVLDFLVDPDHLLTARGHARLGRRGSSRGDHDVAIGEPVLRQLGA